MESQLTREHLEGLREHVAELQRSRAEAEKAWDVERTAYRRKIKWFQDVLQRYDIPVEEETNSHEPQGLSLSDSLPLCEVGGSTSSCSPCRSSLLPLLPLQNRPKSAYPGLTLDDSNQANVQRLLGLLEDPNQSERPPRSEVLAPSLCEKTSPLTEERSPWASRGAMPEFTQFPEGSARPSPLTLLPLQLVLEERGPVRRPSPIGDPMFDEGVFDEDFEVGMRRSIADIVQATDSSSSEYDYTPRQGGAGREDEASSTSSESSEPGTSPFRGLGPPRRPPPPPEKAPPPRPPRPSKEDEAEDEEPDDHDEVGLLVKELERAVDGRLDERAMLSLRSLSRGDSIKVIQRVDELVQAQDGRCRNLSSVLQSACRKLEVFGRRDLRRSGKGGKVGKGGAEDSGGGAGAWGGFEGGEEEEEESSDDEVDRGESRSARRRARRNRGAPVRRGGLRGSKKTSGGEDCDWAGGATRTARDRGRRRGGDRADEKGREESGRGDGRRHSGSTTGAAWRTSAYGAGGGTSSTWSEAAAAAAPAEEHSGRRHRRGRGGGGEGHQGAAAAPAAREGTAQGRRRSKRRHRGDRGGERRDRGGEGRLGGREEVGRKAPKEPPDPLLRHQ